MKSILTVCVLLLFFVSCKTYHISKEDFKKQLVEHHARTSTSSDQEANSNVYDKNKVYTAFDLYYFDVLDKKGNKHQFFSNNPSKIRVTSEDGKKRNFYLSTITLENDSLAGYNSYIFGKKHKVAFDLISKIEFQYSTRYTGPPSDIDKSLEIEKNSNKTYKSKGDIIKTTDFETDIYTASITEYKKLYYVSCKFKDGISTLRFLFYLNYDNELEAIIVSESSPFEKEIDYYRKYYLENEVVFYEESSFLAKDFNQSSSQYKNTKAKDRRFNKTFTTQYLTSLAFELYNKIKAEKTKMN